MIVCAVGCSTVMKCWCLQRIASLQRLHEQCGAQQAMGQSHQVHHSTPHDHALLPVSNSQVFACHAGSYQYNATIPSSAVTTGSLVRWYVQVRLMSSGLVGC